MRGTESYGGSGHFKKGTKMGQRKSKEASIPTVGQNVITKQAGKFHGLQLT